MNLLARCNSYQTTGKAVPQVTCAHGSWPPQIFSKTILIGVWFMIHFEMKLKVLSLVLSMFERTSYTEGCCLTYLII